MLNDVAAAVQKLAPTPTGREFARRLGLRQFSGSLGRHHMEKGSTKTLGTEAEDIEMHRNWEAPPPARVHLGSPTGIHGLLPLLPPREERAGEEGGRFHESPPSPALPMNCGGRARRSARAVRRSPGTERRARSDAPYLFWWVHGFKARMVSRNSLPVRNERGEGHPTADTLTHLQARRPSSPPSEG